MNSSPEMTQDQAQEVIEEAIETSDFGRLFPLLVESYEAEKAKYLDPHEVKVVVETLLDMNNTIMALSQELSKKEEESSAKKKLWKP